MTVKYTRCGVTLVDLGQPKRAESVLDHGTGGLGGVPLARARSATAPTLTAQAADRVRNQEVSQATCRAGH